MLIAIIALVLGAALYVMNMLGVNINANVIFSVGVLVVGFVMLIKGADLFVEGASKIAAKFKIPLIVIGLTIVAMGTSAPEAAISISAAFQDAAAISIGNAVGSNIMNILLILGVSALITNLKIKPNTLRFEIPFVVVITAVLLLLGWIGGGLDKIDGVIMLVLFAAFLGYLFYLAKKGDDSSADDVPELTEKDKLPILIVITLIGLVSIVLGSDLTVSAAKNIAQTIGIDDRTISLTVVAFGTSLPELITCITASLKKKSDIAIGNIIGSNIFNILFVVGLASIFSPSTLPFGQAFVIDTIVAIAAAVILGLLVLRKKELSRIGGVIMLASYAVYFAYIFVGPSLFPGIVQ
ncbi:MAG: calcium/sodium antiporter [Ruminiclostridium sp.]